MNLPPPGLCLPCKWRRTVDGDTIVVDLGGTLTMHVRLLDCWAIETKYTAGRAAAHALESLLEETADQPMHVWFPPPRDSSPTDGILALTELIRHAISFGRFVGRIFAGSVDVGEWMIDHGHAYRTRKECKAAEAASLKR